MPGPGRRPAGQSVHGARPAGNARRARGRPSGASPGRRIAARCGPVEEISVPVLIIGGGPAGLSAAIELGKRGIETLLVDDKHRLGGKLVLQTHRFFGSYDLVYAGTRGIDIATKLETELRTFPSVRIWLQSTALAVFSDQKVGILAEGTATCSSSRRCCS